MEEILLIISIITFLSGLSILLRGRIKLQHSKVSGKKLVLLVRKGNTIRKVKANLREDGSIVTKDKLYSFSNLTPYVFIEGLTARQCLIVDNDTCGYYTFNDSSKTLDLKTDPEFLKSYIGKKVIQQLAGKLKATKIEIVMYLLMGMSLAYILQFFLLPLMGFNVRIGR